MPNQFDSRLSRDIMRNVKRITRVWAGRISVVAALLLFWGVALWRLGAPSFWYDELFNVNLILGHDLSGMFTVLRTQQPYPPLYYLFLKGWAALLGARPYAPGLEPGSGLEFLLRFPSVLAGVLSLALLFPLGRRLHISGARFLPWLLAVHPVFLWYARDARMYALWVLLTLAAIYALMAQRRWLWWGAAPAALLTHYFALSPLAGAATVAFFTGNLNPPSRTGARPCWLIHLATLGAPFLFLLVWILVALRVALGFQSFGTGSPPDGATFMGIAGPDLLTARVFLEPLGQALNPWWAYGVLGLALVGLMLRAWKAPSRGGICLGAAILGAAATFIGWQLRPVQHVRYLIWLLPLLAPGLAGLVSTLCGRRRAAARGTLAVLGLLVFLWGARQSQAFMTAARTVWYPDFRDTVRLLNERALPGDSGIAVAAHGAEIFTAYRSPVTFVPGPTIGERMQPETAARLASVQRGSGGRVWTLLYQDEAVDPGQVLIGTLEAAGGYRVEMGYSRELRLYAYALPQAASLLPLAPQHPLESTFEGGVALRGWSLHREERLVAVYLFWELLAPQTEAWMGAVHLAPNAASAPTVQRDKVALSDYWTLPDLPVGEIIPDRYEMVIPVDLPAGTYQLFALLYAPDSGQRLPLTTGVDRLYLGDFVWQ
ncbi:MAG: hypothetical protein JW892_02570 [Anaerolineae bacterium]|nr:hypothetical protein [Anaerolineae bacterium]